MAGKRQENHLGRHFSWTTLFFMLIPATFMGFLIAGLTWKNEGASAAVFLWIPLAFIAATATLAGVGYLIAGLGPRPLAEGALPLSGKHLGRQGALVERLRQYSSNASILRARRYTIHWWAHWTGVSLACISIVAWVIPLVWVLSSEFYPPFAVLGRSAFEALKLSPLAASILMGVTLVALPFVLVPLLTSWTPKHCYFCRGKLEKENLDGSQYGVLRYEFTMCHACKLYSRADIPEPGD